MAAFDRFDQKKVALSGPPQQRKWIPDNGLDRDTHGVNSHNTNTDKGYRTDKNGAGTECCDGEITK